MTSLAFHFDPGCPYTWLVSRWLVDAAPRAGIDVTLRPYPLTLINGDNEVPAEFQPIIEVSYRASRVVQSLNDEGRGDAAHRLYTELGTRRWVGGADHTDALVVEAGHAAGVDDVADRMHDASVDASIRSGFDEVRAIVGPDVGSPVIRLNGTDQAFFGPIVNPAPRGDDADRLLTAMLALLEVPGLFEIKRSRSGDLDFS
ncbi:MAG: disulfide bond formation protein DsbA [Actinomycetes bacterium]